VPAGAAGVAVVGAVVAGVVVDGEGVEGIDGAGGGLVVVPDVPTGWDAGRDGVVAGGVCAIAAAVLSRNSKETGIDLFIATSS
jgi:hypothetical protein